MSDIEDFELSLAFLPFGTNLDQQMESYHQTVRVVQYPLVVQLDQLMVLALMEGSALVLGAVASCSTIRP